MSHVRTAARAPKTPRAPKAAATKAAATKTKAAKASSAAPGETKPASRARARVAPFIARKMKALDAALGEALPRVLAAADDEAIHDLRVAIRRLRTLLKLARPVYGRFHADAVRRAFTDIQSATGDLRDEEVLDETLDEVPMEDETFIAWKNRRQARERRLRRTVVDRLRTGDLTRARSMLRGLLALPVKPSRNKDLARFARKCVERTRARVDAQRDVDPDDVAGMHELRIAYKELRYSAELLCEALPLDLRVLADPAAKFQKRLGEVHDVDMALVTVTRARALDPHVRAAAMELITKLRDKKVAKYLAEMTPDPDPEVGSG